ncbi:hypothetical protein [Henriciella marina]|uniref:hypothetical protein n=1 Tax=Henriciella marina TaxID=453851 RepID=UPI00035DBBD6|nr:hypothetical protein [Henriciella marina]
MLNALIDETAKRADIDEATARRAIGIVLNAAERQGSEMIETVFAEFPEMRRLSVITAREEKTPTGSIARLIEQTPGGRRHVALDMVSRLHKLGLGHKAVAEIMAATGASFGSHFSRSESALLADLFENTESVPETGRDSAVA